MSISEFFTQNKFQICGVSIFITELIIQTIGWIYFYSEYIISSPYCTYFMMGNSVCPLFFDGFDNSERIYDDCYQFNDACDSAKKIRNTYLAALSLPLCLAFLFICFLLLVFIKKVYKFQLLITIIWIAASIISSILFIFNAKNIDYFYDESSYSVNLIIREGSYIMLAIRCLQILILINFNYYYYRDFVRKVTPIHPAEEKQDTYLTGTAEPIDINLEIR